MNRILMIMFARSVGGAELQFLELANHLSKNNVVRVLCLGGDGALDATHIFDAVDIKVYSYSSRVSALFGVVRAFFENIGYSACSVVTTSFIGDFLGYFFGIFKRVRLISLQTVSVCIRHPIIDRFILRRYDVLIAGANDIKDYLVTHGQKGDKVIVVHNWVDFSKRKPSDTADVVRRSMHIEGKLIVGCVGRLHPQKGQLYLIRAFSKVLENYPEAVLVLVGDGPSRDILVDEVNALDMGNSVIFTGTVSGEEYNNILNVMDIYVQPSVFEGLPRTLLDAMYMSKAIIASDINGNCEAIDHEKTGYLVSSKDVEALYGALVTLIDNPNIRCFLGQQATEAAILRFDMNKQFERIDKIISSNTL